MSDKPEQNDGADEQQSAAEPSDTEDAEVAAASEEAESSERSATGSSGEDSADESVSGKGDEAEAGSSGGESEKAVAATATAGKAAAESDAGTEAKSDDSTSEDSKAAKPAKPKAPTKPATTSVDTEVSRRGFFSWAAVAWVGFTAAIGGCMTAFGRFMFPNVLYEPPNQFKVGVPEDFPKGVVDERFKESNGVFIVNNDGQLYALFAICTHLGCPPAWLEAQNKFKCPCHGSGYYKSGINFEGPTPRPLERAKIALSPDDGQIEVDKGQKYQWELGQWQDPNSYIALG